MANLQKIIPSTFYLLPFTFYLAGCTVPQKKMPSPPTGPVMPVEKVILPSLPPAPPVPTKEIIIKIGLLENVTKASITSDDKLIISDIKTTNKFEFSNGKYPVRIINSKIIFGKQQFLHDIKISTKKNNSKISVNDKKYKGEIIIKITNRKKLTVINEIGLEEYLCGVITKETAPDWHIEALKAQAVVARTFALKNFNRHIISDFNLCNQTHCQVYGGADAEDERSNKAVYETASEVLVYNDELISSFYHSSCGGRTEDMKNVWNTIAENPEYLSSVKCGFCKNDKWYNWSTKIPLKTISAKLRAYGYRIGEVKKIKTVGRTSSDRVKEILVERSNGKLWLLSNRFRMAVGPNTIRSTNFTVKIKNGIVYFYGHGWGHGVGLCQWGAKGMAEAGWDYKEILRHFFKGTKIKKIEDIKWKTVQD